MRTSVGSNVSSKTAEHRINWHTMRHLFLILLLSSTVAVAAQKSDPPPFRIQLLKGYHHKTLQGIDTTIGQISKRHGLLIRYDLGDLPVTVEREIRPFGDWNRLCSWIKDDNDSSVTGETEVNCKIDTDEDGHKKKLFVVFPDGATFWARVKNKRQISEMLKMVLTYHPS
jgi:hypothetical protein